MSLIHEKAVQRFHDLVASSDGICLITHEPIVKPAYTLCGHVFEWDALIDWRNMHSEKDVKHWKCPYCSYVSTVAFIHSTQKSAIYFLEKTPIRLLPKY
jgi:hypothetical protein